MIAKLLQWLRGSTATKKLSAEEKVEDASSRDGPLIHIHEDDWGMRNIYPLAALDRVLADVETARRKGEENFDGFGWTDVHAVEEPATSFETVDVSIEQIVDALAPIMPRVKRFYATIGSYMRENPGSADRDPYGSYDDDAVCFGFGSRCFIKIDTREPYIRSIWFQAETRDPPELEALVAGLAAINAIVPCAVADYWLDEAGSLSDKAFTDRYYSLLRGDEGPSETER